VLGTQSTYPPARLSCVADRSVRRGCNWVRLRATRAYRHASSPLWADCCILHRMQRYCSGICRCVNQRICLAVCSLSFNGYWSVFPCLLIHQPYHLSLPPLMCCPVTLRQAMKVNELLVAGQPEQAVTAALRETGSPFVLTVRHPVSTCAVSCSFSVLFFRPVQPRRC
jgi:hypothetical protein